jgi:acetoin utilization deacetylase AcuC-like enzyme
MKLYYSDLYTIDLPDGHRFPMSKYTKLRHNLLNKGIVAESDLQSVIPCSKETLCLAHSEQYVDAIFLGTADYMTIRKIGFPWSESLVRRSCATVGGAISSAYTSLENGISGNLAGGTHHAMTSSGEGFCVFNDFAVVSRLLIKENKVKKIAIIDLDVHQGNGNSEILGNDDSVFIFSMHGEKNYPFSKVPSSIDIGLNDNTTDDEYLQKLSDILPTVYEFSPDIILYQAGVDPLKEDALGRLDLSMKGLQERDKMVFESAFSRGIPISIAIGGGYCKNIDITVEAYSQIFSTAITVFE